MCQFVGQLILRQITKIVASGYDILKLQCSKSDFAGTPLRPLTWILGVLILRGGDGERKRTGVRKGEKGRRERESDKRGKRREKEGKGDEAPN